ncbi:MAG: hypothetical protein ACM3NH_03575 [Candidatus Saccharibacteria bacterium]
MFKDSSFWLSQPPMFLTRFDNWAAYGLIAALAVGLVLWFIQRFVKHEVVNRLVSRIRNLAISMSIIGLLWVGFRYENTPIFSRRAWFLAIFIIGLIWLGFIVKYFFTGFRSEKRDYEFNLQNSRYLNNRRKN